MAVQVRMTAEQLAELTDDRYKKSELVKGELIVMSPTGFEHGIVSARIAQILNDFVRARGLGYICGAETGFILQRNPDTVRAPDVAFVRKETRLQSLLPIWPWRSSLPRIEAAKWSKKSRSILQQARASSGSSTP
jgi:Uma2 family endonuclease